jgi:hypothetical protein
MKTNRFSRPSNSRLTMAIIAVVVILVQVACITSAAPAPAAPVVDETKIALGVAATSYAIQQTADAGKAADEKAQQQSDDLQKTMDALSLQETAIALQQNQQPPQQQQPPAVNVQPPVEPPTPDPMAGMDEKIHNAKILIFEDTVELGIGQWIEETVQRMDIPDYVQTDDYSGTFMERLNSPTQWDLIIVGAEAKSKIQGEFWDAIMTHVNRKVAVIAEVWYLDLLGNGRIKAFTSECGVSYAGNYDLAESIYWWDQFHPVFTNPNIAEPLIHYSRYWGAQTGDKLRVSGGDAKLVAGDRSKPHSDGGVIAVCMGGRTIIQTFSNHDYHEDQIKDLWENYITYTLTNHFLATQ